MDGFTSNTKVGDGDEVNYFDFVKDLTFIHKVSQQLVNINFDIKFFGGQFISELTKF